MQQYINRQCDTLDQYLYIYAICNTTPLILDPDISVQQYYSVILLTSICAMQYVTLPPWFWTPIYPIHAPMQQYNNIYTYMQYVTLSSWFWAPIYPIHAPMQQYNKYDTLDQYLYMYAICNTTPLILGPDISKHQMQQYNKRQCDTL